MYLAIVVLTYYLVLDIVIHSICRHCHLQYLFIIFNSQICGINNTCSRSSTWLCSKIFADKHAARAAEMVALGVWSDDDEDDVGDG